MLAIIPATKCSTNGVDHKPVELGSIQADSLSSNNTGIVTEHGRMGICGLTKESDIILPTNFIVSRLLFNERPRQWDFGIYQPIAVHCQTRSHPRIPDLVSWLI